jgi:hypothetical protein
MKKQSDTTSEDKRRFGKVIKYSARIGTGLLLMALVFSCATVPGLREESAGTFIRIPFVRVLLDENIDRSEMCATSPGWKYNPAWKKSISSRADTITGSK